MKFPIDMTASPQLVSWLEERGEEAVHVYHLGLETADDAEIIALARRQNRVVITVDLDFGRILALSEAEGPGVILFRGGNYSEAEMRELLERVLAAVEPEVIAKAICVVDRSRVRVTRLPLQRRNH